MLTNSHPSRLILVAICALTLLQLSACTSTASVEPPLIARKPTPTPLPAAILQIKPQPSIAICQKADNWLERSGQTLKSGMQK